jgi:tetratricopeptide (TPR) repeat protein
MRKSKSEKNKKDPVKIKPHANATGREAAEGRQAGRGHSTARILVIIGAVLALAVLVYSNSVNNGFTNWDDGTNVYENTAIRDPGANIKTYFTKPLLAMYTPLVYISYAIDYKIGGLDPRIYHLTNLLLHLANITLVFLIVRQFTQRVEIAVIVTLLFAIHPLNAGAVAPVSLRSSLLFSCFYLAAFYSYLLYLNSGFRSRYLVYTLLFFLMSLLSKSAAVTLPVLLGLTDWYMRRRFDRRAILEKVPFFVFSVIFGILTILFREDAGHLGSTYVFTFLERICLVTYAIAFYLVKLFLPVHLSPYYPYPDKVAGMLPLEFYLSPLALLAIAGIIIWAKQFRRELVFGLIFFLVHVTLVLKFIPMGGEMVCDRYMYLPGIGIFLILGWAYCRVLEGRGAVRSKAGMALTALMVIAVLVFSVMSHIKIRAWKDSLTMYGDVLDKYPNLALAYDNRGSARAALKDYTGAIADYNRALELRPDFATVYANRAYIYQKMGNYKKALEDDTRAIQNNPRSDMAYNNRGFHLMLMGELESAERDISIALEINPKNIDALNSMAELFAARNDPETACKWLGKAVEKGYNDWNYLKTSGTYENIRASVCFRRIIAGK